MTEDELRAQMCAVGRRLYERDLVGATEGNLSARVAPGLLLCTPSGVSKGHLEPEQLVLISAAGEPVRGGCPSSEIKLHLAIYGALPDCNAVVHAHPITATAFAMEEKTIDTRANEEAATVLGDVALVPFAPSGSAELGRAIMPLLNGRSAFLLTRHGAVTLGSDLWEAFYRMETLERFARILAAQAKLPPK